MERFHSRPALTVVCTFAVASAAMGQTDTLYVTDGDSARLAIVQGGVLQAIRTTHIRGYPIAVRGTIWIGDYNGAQPNSIEYDLAGFPTGGSVPYTPVNAVDGAVNGDTNYQLGRAFSTNAAVYSANANWSGQQPMFNVAGTDLVGITFDGVSGNLWVSDRNSIYQYGLGGNLISQFAHSSGRGCIAWEPSTDTIWYVRNGSNQIDQYSKTGSLLQSLTVTGLASNNWGAEFPMVAAGVRLSREGACPGRVTATVRGATPDGQVGLIYARNTGNFTIPPAQPCAGTQLGLGSQAIRLVATTRADGNGVAVFSGNAPAPSCGGHLQAIDVRTCSTSNVEQL